MRLRPHETAAPYSLVLLHALAAPVAARQEGIVERETLRDAKLVQEELAAM